MGCCLCAPLHVAARCCSASDAHDKESKGSHGGVSRGQPIQLESCTSQFPDACSNNGETVEVGAGGAAATKPKSLNRFAALSAIVLLVFLVLSSPRLQFYTSLVLPCGMCAALLIAYRLTKGSQYLHSKDQIQSNGSNVSTSSSLQQESDGKVAEAISPMHAGVLSQEQYAAGTPSSDWKLPLECRPLTPEQEEMFAQIRDAVARLSFADLKRDFDRAVWLVEPDRTTDRSKELVPWEAREIVRVVQSLSACKQADFARVGSSWLQQIYALRFDHGMDLPSMKLSISSDEIAKAKVIFPKACFGLSKPHGYPIMWDLVSALRVKELAHAFGSLEAGLDRILWYDLHIMELFERYKRRLSSERGGVHLIKGVSIIDLGAWSADLLNPGIMRTCQKIISRSGCIWPESVWRIYLINVPFVFMGPWQVIKQACHPVTLEKLRLFSSKEKFLKHLEEDLGITPDMVPRENGGSGPSLRDLPFTPTADLDNSQ